MSVNWTRWGCGPCAGGGSRTDETIPGYRFDTPSAAHNIINMTRIPAELDLAGAGLRYTEMEPFATGIFRDGRIVRFHRGIDATVDSIAEHDRAEADAYRDLMRIAVPLVRAAVAGLEPGIGIRLAVTRLPALLRAHLRSDLTRGPVAAFAAHGSAGPHTPGSGFFARPRLPRHHRGGAHPPSGADGHRAALAQGASHAPRHHP